MEVKLPLSFNKDKFCSIHINNKASPTVEKVHHHLWSSPLDVFCLIYGYNFHDKIIPL